MTNTFRAALWMIGAICSFTAMAVAGRAVSIDLDTFEIMLYRSITGIVIVSGALTVLGAWSAVRTDRLGLHVLRNVFHFTGQNLWFYAITVLPLAQVFAFEFTTPIWVIILSPLFLGESFNRIKALTVIFGFIGILLVAKPDPSNLTWGLFAAALCAVGFAMTTITTKTLTATEPILTILFYLTLLQALFGLVCAGYDGAIAVPDLAIVPWVILIGIAGLAAHFCLTTALSLAPASVVTPIDFVRLPVIVIVGYTLYGENIDIWVILGASLIFAANYANIRWGNR